MEWTHLCLIESPNDCSALERRPLLLPLDTSGPNKSITNSKAIRSILGEVSELTSTGSTRLFLLSHCTKGLQTVWAFLCGGACPQTDRQTAYGKHQVVSSQRPAAQTYSRLFLWRLSTKLNRSKNHLLSAAQVFKVLSGALYVMMRYYR